MDNIVRLINFAGSDRSHAIAAWASTQAEITEAKIDSIPRLLNFLAENKHTTPFEHSWLQFHICSDIATHIHILKHRIGVSVNSESARYKEYREDKFYIPHDWSFNLQSELDEWIKEAYRRYHNAIDVLVAGGMSRKRAKESARFFLPYGIQLNYVVSFNFHSFIHFQRLRNSEHAQVEIQVLAKKMVDQVWETGKFNHSLEAWFG